MPDPTTLSAEMAACVERYERTGDLRELDRAVALARDCGDSRAARGNLASVLLARFEARGGRDDLVAARSALMSLAKSGPITAGQVSQLAAIHRHTYEYDGDPAALELAIRTSRFGLAHALPRDTALPDLHHGLGAALTELFDRDGRVADLDEAVRAYLAAADAADGDRRLGNLVNVVRQSRRRLDLPVPLPDRDLLTTAIAAADEAAAGFPEDVPVCGEMVQASGLLRRFRHEATGDAADIHEAVRRLRRAMSLPVAKPADRPIRLASLGAALHREFQVTGNRDLLEEAVECERRVLAQTPADDPDRSARLNNLAAALRERTLYFNDLDALHEAIGLLREAVGLATAAQGRRTIAGTLGVALQDLFARTGDPRVADEAVAWARETVRLPAVDHHDAKLALGNALTQRYLARGTTGDLAEALRLLDDLVEQVPIGDPARAPCLRGAGRAWQLEFDRTGDLDALDRAITALGRATRADPVLDAARAGYRRDYGRLLLLQHERVRATGPLRSAAETFAVAAADVADAPLDRVRAAGDWLDAAARLGDWPQALEAARLAMSLLPEVASRRLSRADRERSLAQLGGLARNAAACAIQAGDDGLAVRWLEQGRGVLLGQTLDTRGELGELRRRAPHAAGRLAELDQALATLDVAASGSDERHATARERDDLLAEIRALPGFARFLLPPTLEQVHEWAGPGPVVLVNVSAFRCDALVLADGALTAIPLRELTFDDAADNADRFAEALEAAHEPGREHEGGRVLADVLTWLDTTVTAPVLDRLDRDGARVWWSPGGPLTSLPLHAAGGPGRSVLDRVVSSYTPTVRALGHARAAAGRPGDPAGMVAVAVPEPLAAPPLLHAEEEIAAIGRIWPTAAITGAAATPDRVLGALGEHACVHLACHGVHEPADPSASRLLLHGDALSVREVSRAHLPRARLAVLSACHTARGGADLADEALHLAGAFQLAGYPSVVATLWQVNDLMATRIAIAFHTALAAGGPPAPGRAAAVLHEVLRGFRDYPPSVWAGWVHSGA